MKEKIREAKQNLEKIEPKQPPLPDVTPLVRHPKQPPVTVSEKTNSIEDLFDDPFPDPPRDWVPLIDKLAAMGLCGGFISLGIVIGLHLH